MIQFKTCPKCHGDLYLSEDVHGAFLSCLQCGYLRDIAPEVAVATFASEPTKEAKQKKVKSPVAQAA